jgi:hypothetical protein
LEPLYFTYGEKVAGFASGLPSKVRSRYLVLGTCLVLRGHGGEERRKRDRTMLRFCLFVASVTQLEIELPLALLCAGESL